MACLKGRVNPTPQTKLRLFSDAAGHCNRPSCRLPLFSEEGRADYHIGEMAHILAAGDAGPRAEPALDRQERASYDNLILLCPNCHTEVDKSVETFPDSLLRGWKQDHKAVILAAFGIQSVSTRDEALRFVQPLLRANESIHQQYGPESATILNPEAEEAIVWKRKMIHQIIPNSQKILLFADKNANLLRGSERIVLELFRQHVDDLAERHLGNNRTIASRFPMEMNRLFERH